MAKFNVTTTIITEIDLPHCSTVEQAVEYLNEHSSEVDLAANAHTNVTCEGGFDDSDVELSDDEDEVEGGSKTHGSV